MYSATPKPTTTSPQAKTPEDKVPQEIAKVIDELKGESSNIALQLDFFQKENHKKGEGADPVLAKLISDWHVSQQKLKDLCHTEHILPAILTPRTPKNQNP